MEPFVEVTGTGSASGAPDIIALDVTVRCPGVSVAAALGEADAKMRGILAHAEESGLASRDVQSTGSSVYPQYDREGVHVSGYVAQQSVRLRVRDRSLVGPLITEFSAIAGNALGIDNISLLLDDPSALLEQARRSAFDDAHAKARQFATLAERSLGAVVYCTDAPGGSIPMPAYEMRMAMKDSAGGAEIAPGESTVTASVTVRWSWV